MGAMTDEIHKIYVGLCNQCTTLLTTSRPYIERRIEMFDGVSLQLQRMYHSKQGSQTLSGN